MYQKILAPLDGSELALNCVSQGATYRQIKGILQLTMKNRARKET